MYSVTNLSSVGGWGVTLSRTSNIWGNGRPCDEQSVWDPLLTKSSLELFSDCLLDQCHHNQGDVQCFYIYLLAMLTLMSLNLLVRLTLSPVCWRTVSGLGQDLFSSFLMWTRGAVILLVISVSVTTLTRSLWVDPLSRTLEIWFINTCASVFWWTCRGS